MGRAWLVAALVAVSGARPAGASAAAGAKARFAVGAQGPTVRRLELGLAWHGFPSGALDGRFGPEVASAVRRFQRSVGLPANGVAGPDTLAALRRPAPRSPIPLGWPLLAPLGDRFGLHGGHFHAGLDLLAPAGTEVIAAAPGTVSWAAPRDGWGNLVVVRHPDGVRTFYAHLESIAVHVGEWIPGGWVLGRVGETGDATGPHLHFEVRVRGAAVNPLSALVRLGTRLG